MKKLILLFLLLPLSFISYSQTYPSGCLVKTFSSSYNRHAPIDVVTRGDFKSVYVPVSFARLVYNNVDRTISLGETFNIGGSYVIGSANVNIHADNSVTLTETFYYGVATTFGAAQNNGGTVSTLTFGVVGGFNQFSLLAGRDFLQKKFVLGINYNLAGLPFFNSVTKISLR